MGGEGLMTIQVEWSAGRLGVVVLEHLEIGCVGPTGSRVVFSSAGVVWGQGNKGSPSKSIRSQP
jgi:hypothetical protein